MAKVSSNDNRPSGKSERVIISCVTFEVAMNVEPALFYEASRVYLIHYDNGTKPIYGKFYNQVVKELTEGTMHQVRKANMPKEELDALNTRRSAMAPIPESNIIEVNGYRVFDFTDMMNAVMSIIQKEINEHGKEVIIYVNLSAGTSQYISAATLVSMMYPGVVAFTVPTMDFQVEADRLEQVYFEKGAQPVGLTWSCHDPIKLKSYPIERPDTKLVIGLGVLNEHIGKKKTSASDMIIALYERGIIEVGPEHFVAAGPRRGALSNVTEKNKDIVGKKPDQTAVMAYQRNFVDRWKSNGWIEKISKRTVAITPEGKTILETFLKSYTL
jgi:hypothetical protein